MDAENKVQNMSVLNVDLRDLRRIVYGEVIALIRLMPDGVLSDDEIQTIIDEVRNVIKEPVKLGKVEVKNIAFGLRGLNVTVSVPDSEGGLDPVVEVFLKIDKIENVEVVDIGRI